MTQGFWVSMPIIRNIVMGSIKNNNELLVICKAGGITPENLEDASQKLTLDQNCVIMDACLNISNDPHLGLHIGEKTTPVILGITGHLMQSSKDVLTALQNLQQFTSTFTRLYHFSMEISGDEAIYYCEPLQVWNDISPDTARHSVDIAFAGALHIIRLLTGQRIIPKRILYRYSRISNTTEHEQVLKCKPLFNQQANCIIFNVKDLHFPVIGYNQELNGIFRKLLEEELKKQNNGETFSNEVRKIILKHYDWVFPQLEEIASVMHITPRTLQRKLQEENTSFRSLSDALKQELACSLLGNQNLSIADIASKLGYTEPTAFQRAFRQWTGKTPGAFRNEPGE